MLLYLGVGEIKKLEHCSFKIWSDVINANLNNQFLLIKSLLPYLKLSKKASIINLSSTVGREPRADWGAYAVSKVIKTDKSSRKASTGTRFSKRTFSKREGR